MRFNRQSLITLVLVTVVGVGLVGAYASNACDSEKTAQTASAKECTAEQMAACKAAKTAAGDACCAKKAGAQQASASEAGAAIIPVGSGGACPHSAKAIKAGSSCNASAAKQAGSGSGCSFEAAANCDGCKLHQAYWTSLENASRDIASLPNGIVVHYASSDPVAAVELQKYAAEKATLWKTYSSKKSDVQLCDYCAEKASSMKGATFQVSNSMNGVFTVITAKSRGTVENLHRIAAAMVTASAEAKVEG